jgi:diadenosine tetraphosphate (Ap4A) HIT family hydrolase
MSGYTPLPGGVIHEADYWVVEHCVGPLGVGTLLVKPKRHVTRVSDLLDDEAAEVGPLLHRSAAVVDELLAPDQVVDELLAPDQVYVCLWSHAGGVPGHVHHVVQPVTAEVMNEYEAYGPRLQVAMFEVAEALPEDEVVAFADRARAAF